MKLNLLTPAILLIAILLTTTLSAQVTIGSGEKPNTGALLDLKERDATILDPTTANKGLGLPRVVLTSPGNLFPMFAKADGTATAEYAADKAGTKTIDKSHIGLVVYNTNTVTGSAATLVCPGLHVWDGDKWSSIVPYPTITPTKTEIGRTITAETSRTDITGTAGYTVGSLNQFTDTRGPNGVEVNQYHHARFYAHKVQATEDITYRGIKNPYVCDASLAVIEDWTETGVIEYIDDGVWMTENLNTEYLTATSPDKMVKSAANNYITPQYFSPLNTGASPTQIIQNGFLYNWAAATNQKGGTSTGQENIDNPGVLQEQHSLHKQRQGICPTGWHLPSDKEYNELEATYAPSSSNFTNSPTTAFDWTFDLATSWRPNSLNVSGHGKSMKSTTTLNGTATAGDSKTAANGGFNLLLAGYAGSGSAAGFGTGGYFWSSSSNSGSNAWNRNVYSGNAGVARYANSRNSLFSVRCKKND